MKKFTFYCLLAALCPFVDGYGQVKQLRIGDAVPTMRFTNVMNHNGQPLQLPGGKGKAIILDFFATWCGGCIKDLPKLAALEDSMQGRLEIWLVSREPKGKLEAFLQKRTAAKGFPIIYEDSLLNALFPNRLLPHDVWINAAGIAAAITNSEQINFLNLHSLVAEKQVALPVTKDIIASPSEGPIRELGAPNALWESFFSTAIAGAGNLSGFIRQDGRKRLIELNASRLRLYQSAWGMPANKIVLQVIAPNVWPEQPQKGESWVLQHHYCYELIGPDTVAIEQYRRHVRVDLDLAFNCTSRLDSADMPVITLLPVSNPATRSGGAIPAVGAIQYDAEQAITTLQQQPLPAIVRWLNGRTASMYRGLPFTNAAVADGQLYTLVVRDTQLTHVDSLEGVLAEAGIAIQRGYVKTQVLSIIQPTQ